jgi:hypothetical protein
VSAAHRARVARRRFPADFREHRTFCLSEGQAPLSQAPHSEFNAGVERRQVLTRSLCCNDPVY